MYRIDSYYNFSNCYLNFLINSSKAWIVNFDEINSLNYTPSNYICFLVQTPKMREVFASNFRDRVVHHLLVNDLESLFEPMFIYDSYSCRVAKGTHKAVQRTQDFTRKQTNSFYMQLDIKNFFLSIDKDILYNRINEIVIKKDAINASRILYLSKQIIFDKPSEKFSFRGDFKKHSNLAKHKSLLYTMDDKGLPIGNLTSQFFANVYLDMMDNYIKRVLKVKYYLRYVDDFILFGSSKDNLLEIKNNIEIYLEYKLKLKLRDKFYLRKVETGIDFLGYIIRPHYKLVRNRVVNNFKTKKFTFFKKCFKDGTCSFEDAKKFKAVNASYYGHFKHASSYRLIQKYEMESWL